jgi:hypothetical protein
MAARNELERLIDLEARVALLEAGPAGKVDAGEAVRLRLGLQQALAAIKGHRDSIFGPDHDYAADETYQPEARLYAVIPSIEKLLGPAPKATVTPKPRRQTPI